MTLFKDINLPFCPNTVILKGLNDQLLAEMQALAPSNLVKIDDLNVVLGSGAIPFVGGPTAKAKLKAAIDRRGVTMKINSAYRTFAQQFLLFREKQFGRGGCGIAKVANPGRSNHESGLALDIQDPLTWKPFMQAQGWRHFGSGDLPHYDFMGGTDLRKLGIMAFQVLWNKHNPTDKIKPDGLLLRKWQDSETIKRLLKTPIHGFGGRPTLQNGDTGSLVEEIQTKLKVDTSSGGFGTFGPKTKAAIQKFQREKGIVPDDGIVDSKTWAALDEI